MAGYVLQVAGEENISLSPSVVRRLLAGDHGDAALLFLCLLKDRGASPEHARAELKWSAERFRAAEDALAQMGLIAPPAAEEIPTAAPTADQRPDYTRADVAEKLEKDGRFAALLAEVERKLGRLSEPSVEKLLGLYDYLGLPAEVIFLLVTYCIERWNERFHALPTMRQIEQEGYAWARRELFSTAAADEYIKREAERRSSFGAYMNALQLGGRKPSPGEEKYLSRWADMGFPPESAALAYDKTVLHCHEFKWAYCNGILKRWHEKGLHTPEEVAAENRAPRTEKKEKPSGRNDWMKDYL